MIRKRILVPERLRRPPTPGWSWMDRRFLREYADRLSHDAVLLYLFFAAVSDRHGLSYYGDTTLSARLRLPVSAVNAAREELLARDLIAHQPPLIQVLSLPSNPVQRREEPGQGLRRLGELLRPKLDARADDEEPPTAQRRTPS